jgi:hypothetical protein
MWYKRSSFDQARVYQVHLMERRLVMALNENSE